jgi:N-methylhydantoinase B
LQRGGDGAIREIELLADAQLSLLADRRIGAPYGLQGGAAGKSGTATLIKRDGKRRQKHRKLAGKFSLRAECGDRVVIETPGGGGFGKVKSSES